MRAGKPTDSRSPYANLLRSSAVRNTLLPAVISGLLLWASFPPIGWWPLAWVAPYFWLRLVRQKNIDGKKPYGWLYLAGLVHWLFMVHWIRLPHWSAWFGWLALAAYLACYIPAFVGLARIAVHRWHLPLTFVAPATWVGLELARGYLLTGFSMSLLGHSQYKWLSLIQISDIVGAYGVSFAVMLGAAGVAEMIAHGTPFSRQTIVAVVLLAGNVGYGTLRLNSELRREVNTDLASARVALIQGSVDTTFENDSRRPGRTFGEYMELSQRAVKENPDLDLIVWPESMLACEMPTWDEDITPPDTSQESRDEYVSQLRRWSEWFETRVKETIHELNTPLLAGTAVIHYSTEQQRYNTALWIRDDGTVADRYDKMHLVMFGEYIPFGHFLPILYRLAPLDFGLTPGTQPLSFSIGQITFSPLICFENTVPHLVRQQLNALSRSNASPDVLVTITNDGWFWGSSLLDMHLICGVFRAVEIRKPMLISANTGFSAWIDGSGRIVEQGPRRDQALVIADVAKDNRKSPYLYYGDVFARICLLFCVAMAITAFVPSGPQTEGI